MLGWIQHCLLASTGWIHTCFCHPVLQSAAVFAERELAGWCLTLCMRVSYFLLLLQECTSRIERMSSQNLSNALWACAALGHADSRMLGTWAEAVLHKLDMFEPQVCYVWPRLTAVRLQFDYSCNVADGSQ
jgi:hypothetical protein